MKRTPSRFAFLELLVALRGAQHRHLGEVLERDDGDFGGAAANRRARRIERFLDAGIGFGAVSRRSVVETGAQRGPRGVERDEAAADDHDPAAEIHPEAAVDVEQVVDGLDDAVELDARYLEVASTRDADREEHRLEALCAELREAEGRGQRAVEPQIDAERDDAIDLGAQERARQAVLGNAEAHHAAGLGRGLEDRDVVTQQRQDRARRRARLGPRRSRRHGGADRGPALGRCGETAAAGGRRSGCLRRCRWSSRRSCVSGRIDSTPYCSVT